MASVRQTWNAIGESRQRHWGTMVDLFGSDFSITVLGTFLFINGMFWISCVLFTALDVTGRPWFLLKYKVQPEKNCPVSLQDLMKAVKVALGNQLFVGIPFIIGLHYVMKLRGWSCSPEDFPTALEMFMDMTVFTLIEESGSWT